MADDIRDTSSAGVKHHSIANALNTGSNVDKPPGITIAEESHGNGTCSCDKDGKDHWDQPVSEVLRHPVLQGQGEDKLADVGA